MQPRVLVAGIGNIFLGDDAFGVEVAQRLLAGGLPDGARVVDFGIRGLDLAYALLDGYEAVVLVDAAPRGGPIGTLHVLELALDTTVEAHTLTEAHRLDPAAVLRLAATLGARVGRLILVGCEPSPMDESEDFGIEMCAAVRAAIDEAVPLVTSLVVELLGGEESAVGGNGTMTRKEAEPCRD